MDREGATTLCNHAFLRMLGFEREEDAIGRKLHDVIHHSHPDGAHYDKLDCPIYVEEQVLKTSKSSSTVSDKVTNEELRRWLESLNDEDLGRYKM